MPTVTLRGRTKAYYSGTLCGEGHISNPNRNPVCTLNTTNSTQVARKKKGQISKKLYETRPIPLYMQRGVKDTKGIIHRFFTHPHPPTAQRENKIRQ